MERLKTIYWTQPNRGNTPPLHIARRGSRYSTLTGVAWIGNEKLVIAHRSGKRIALFALCDDHQPLCTIDAPCLIDDIAAKQLDTDLWEIAVSGCWEMAFCVFRLTLGQKPTFRLVSVCEHKDRSFAHGVAYDGRGRLWVAYHTGKKPRIAVEGEEYRLPAPWGPRDICFHPSTGVAYAVAVSNNPSLEAYESTMTSVWRYEHNKPRFPFLFSMGWTCIRRLDGVHSDTCAIFGDFLYMPNQHSDELISLDLANPETIHSVGQLQLDFPHGISISPTGVAAIANYDEGTVVLVRL